MMKTAAVLSAGLAVASAQKIDTTEKEWALFKAKFEKNYGEAEHDDRFVVFADNMDYARKYNSEHTTHWLGVNQFSDLTSAEFKAMYLSTVPAKPAAVDYDTWEYKDVKADSKVDWRTKGAVTPVKDQGQCGSCWAFSTTGSTEGANVVAGNKLTSLSEQELVDCAGSTGNMGCNGGLMDNAFKWIMQNGGITTEDNYPYTAQDGQCKNKAEKDDAVVIAKFTDVPQSNEDALMQAVSQQPVSVAIEADQRVFQMYSGGIIDDTSCGTQLDHGVLAVGYCQGSDCPDASSLSKGDGFWIVKNSWAATWGEQGYVRLALHGAGPAGMCGLASQPSYPTVGGAAPGPSSGPSPSQGPSPAPAPSPSEGPSPSQGPSPAPAPGPSGAGCPAGTCPSGTTCCSLNAQNSQWGCCPMDNAVCCSDHQHCCPSGTTCDVSANTCNRGDAVVSRLSHTSLYTALGL